ncbi:hypothetical protein [Phenylobacterium immobile]|uniref:hypothetical protein n=1 Tax=Phenylobacterium immobile TaxID=21 RepID=UPI000AA68A32|nr:hypothetical protein [Phenylobacterium immobile]
MTSAYIDRTAASLHPRRRRPALLIGVMMIALAAAAAFTPRLAFMAMGALAGWLLWLFGALMLGFAIITLSGRLRVIGAIASTCAVGAGAWMTFNPHAGAMTALGLMTAVLVIDGSSALAAALQLRPLPAWRWLLASSATTLCMAALIAFARPNSAVGLGEVLAVAFAASGAALIAVSASPRDS